MKHATYHPDEGAILPVEWDRNVDGDTDTRDGELEVWWHEGLVIVEGAKRGRTLVIDARDLVRVALELTE